MFFALFSFLVLWFSLKIVSNQKNSVDSIIIYYSLTILGSSYHHNNNSRRSTRYPERDPRDRVDRMERPDRGERVDRGDRIDRGEPRERVHGRDRDREMLNYNDDEMLSDRNDRNFDYPRERDPTRDRDRPHNSTSRHLVNSGNNYDDNVDLMRSEREKEKDRYMPSSQGQLLQQQSSRRDRDRDDRDYSPPHRSTNRRVLNAM